MGSSLTWAGPGRRRAGIAAVCLILVVLAGAVQVLHRCTALELTSSGEAGTASAYCVFCMTAQVAALAVATAGFAVGLVARVEASRRPGVVPDLASCFALYVRPPPSH